MLPPDSDYLPEVPIRPHGLHGLPRKVSRLITESSVGRGLILAFGLQSVGVGLVFLSQVVLGRALGLTQYGVYAFLMAMVAAIAIVPQMGAQTGLVRFMAEYRAQGTWNLYRGVYRGWSLAVIGASISLAAVLVVPAVLLPDNILLGSGPSLIVAASIIPLWATMHLLFAMLRANGRILWSFGPKQILEPGLLILGIVAYLLVWGTPDAFTALVVSAGSIASVILIQVLVFVRTIPDEARTVAATYEPSRWAPVAFPIMLEGIIFLAFAQGAIVLVGLVLDSTSTGLFSAAFRTSLLVGLPFFVVEGVAAPLFPKLHVRGEKAALQTLLSGLAHWTFWPALLIVLVFFASGPLVLSLFGEGFSVAYHPLLLLSVGQLFYAATGAAAALLKVTGEHKAALRALVVGSAANATGIVLGALFGGVTGAAAGMAFGLLIYNILLHWQVKRSLGLNPSIFHAVIRRTSS